MLSECRVIALAGFLTVASMATTASAVTGVELIRNEPFRYGKFEARIQFAPGDGVVSSFFLWKDASELPNVFWNEIDIEKLGADCAGYSTNAIYGLPEANHNQDVRSQVDICQSYHTHAIEWTPDTLIWLLDGVEVRRITGADLQAFEDNALPGMQMRFNLWVGNADFGGNFTPGILPVHQFINWVSYSQYSPGAGDEGSDFALVWREDFDAPLSGDWSLGTWPSPFNLSVHSPANLTIVDGKAVLSLTADDAPGFAGVPPVDPGQDVPDTDVPDTDVPSQGVDGQTIPGQVIPGQDVSQDVDGQDVDGQDVPSQGVDGTEQAGEQGAASAAAGQGPGEPAAAGPAVSKGCQLSMSSTTTPAETLGASAMAAAVCCWLWRRRRPSSKRASRRVSAHV
jgi:hypothetical protein